MKREYSSLFKETNTIVTISGDEAEEKAVEEAVKKEISLMSVPSSLEKTARMKKGRSLSAGSVTPNSTTRRTALNIIRSKELRTRKLKVRVLLRKLILLSLHS